MKFCDHKIRVRYADTDQMGVAYYANHLVWFEVGRAEFCRQNGFSYRDLERDRGVFLMVVEAHCEYRVPLRYDEEFTIRTWLKEFRSRSLTFSYRLLSGDDSRVHAEGYTRHVVADSNGRLRSFPSEYGRLLIGTDSGDEG